MAAPRSQRGNEARAACLAQGLSRGAADPREDSWSLTASSSLLPSPVAHLSHLAVITSRRNESLACPDHACKVGGFVIFIFFLGKSNNKEKRKKHLQ